MTDPRDLTSVADLKAWLGITATTADDQLQRLVTAVSVGILNWLGREIRATERTEAYDGTGSDLLMLRQAPVTAVAQVAVDGLEVPAGAYRWSPTALIRTDGGRWATGWANIQVRYTAGFPVVPFEIEQACLELASLRWRERERIGLSSKGMGQETTAYLVVDMPDSVKTALAAFRRVAPC